MSRFKISHQDKMEKTPGNQEGDAEGLSMTSVGMSLDEVVAESQIPAAAEDLSQTSTLLQNHYHHHYHYNLYLDDPAHVEVIRRHTETQGASSRRAQTPAADLNHISTTSTLHHHTHIHYDRDYDGVPNPTVPLIQQEQQRQQQQQRQHRQQQQQHPSKRTKK
jgi:hypothetical protein